MNILVVEDESLVAEMLRRSLEQLGNTCLVAQDADAADRVLRDHTIEAVTLDLGMPGRAGLDWLEDVATTQPDLARRTLVITGRHLNSEDVERLAWCGAGILAKPFTMENLEEAVRAQLAHGAETRPD